MKRSRFSEGQNIVVLKVQEAGMVVTSGDWRDIAVVPL
jgi:hypothetical protein